MLPHTSRNLSSQRGFVRSRAKHGGFVHPAEFREFSVMGKQTEERLRELADAIPQIVWIAAPDGGLTYLNAKATDYQASVPIN